jgi:hypothetical protein
MEVLVEHLGAVQFEIKAQQHKIVCDQPSENGGFDAVAAHKNEAS